MIGQNHIKITLQHELEKNEIGHAYLFCGPRGLGKTTSARLFAKSINCEKRQSGQSEPCNECSSCLDIMANRAVDIVEIDAASNTGVDNVRENIIENSRFASTRGKYKVFIIDEAHMLSTSAFNALLKIMEEPPSHVLFILCTTEIHKLPLTVISRCQRFDFKKVPAKELIALLSYIVKEENKKLDEIVLDRIAAYSEGCVRDAESLLGKILTLGDDITIDQAEIILPRSDFDSVYNFVSYLLEKNSGAAIELVNKLLEEGVELAIFSENLLEFLRQLLLLKVDNRLDVFGVGLSEYLSEKSLELSSKFNYAELVDMIDVFMDKPKEIRKSQIPQFPLEVAVISVVEKIACTRPDSIVFNQTASRPAATASKPPVSQNQLAPTIENKSEITIEAVKKNDILVSAVVEPVATALGDSNRLIAADSNTCLDFNVVLEKWGEVIQKLVVDNFSLASLLKLGQPLKCDGNAIEIAVTNKFFKDRMESNQHRPTIEAIFTEIIGSPVRIKAIVSATVAPIEVALDFGEEVHLSEEVSSASIAEKPLPPIAPAPRLDATEEVLSMF